MRPDDKPKPLLIVPPSQSINPWSLLVRPTARQLFDGIELLIDNRLLIDRRADNQIATFAKFIDQGLQPRFRKNLGSGFEGLATNIQEKGGECGEGFLTGIRKTATGSGSRTRPLPPLNIQDHPGVRDSSGDRGLVSGWQKGPAFVIAWPTAGATGRWLTDA